MIQTSIYTYVTQENHNEPLNAVWLWRLCKYTNATCFCTCVRYKGGIYQWHLSLYRAVYWERCHWYKGGIYQWHLSQYTALYRGLGHWLVAVTDFVPRWLLLDLWMTIVQWNLCLDSHYHILCGSMQSYLHLLWSPPAVTWVERKQLLTEAERWAVVINNGEDKVRYLLSQVLLAMALNLPCSPWLA